MQPATSETKIKSLDLSICVHHYTLRAPCPKGQGICDKSKVYLLNEANRVDLEQAGSPSRSLQTGPC